MKISVRGKVISPIQVLSPLNSVLGSQRAPLCDVCVQAFEDLSSHLCVHYPLNPGCLRLPRKISARKALRQKDRWGLPNELVFQWADIQQAGRSKREQILQPLWWEPRGDITEICSGAEIPSGESSGCWETRCRKGNSDKGSVRWRSLDVRGMEGGSESGETAQQSRGLPAGALAPKSGCSQLSVSI